MAEFKLGRIRFIWKNNWVAGTTYVRDDIVRYGGSIFICTIGHTADSDFYTDLNNVPARWNIMSEGHDWKGDWTTATYYKVNDIVKYGGYLYICNEGHTSAATVQMGLEDDLDLPTQINAKWDLYAEGFDWKGAWTISTKYKINDVVRYGGVTYICNEGHNSSSLTSLGLENDQGKWDLFAETFQWQTDWLPNIRYKVNDVVKYGGTTYVCNFGHTSAATVTLGLEADQGYWDYFNKGFEYKENWNPSSVRYKVNDIVKYGSGIWICIDDHTSSSTFDESKWDQFVEALEFENSWNPTTSYQHGDVVTYGGYAYISITTNNVGQRPTSNSDDWDIFTTGFKFKGDWGDDSSNMDYLVGDVVRLNGYTYVAIADNNNQQPPNVTYWSRLNSGIRWRGVWTDDTEYELGDAVKRGPNSFICIQGHISEGDDGSTIATNVPDLDVNGLYWNMLTSGNENDVLTTSGDLVYYSFSGPARLPVGREGQTLTVVNGIPAWKYWGVINEVYYVGVDGTDGSVSDGWGITLDKPFASVRYAAEKILNGAKNPNAQTLLELNRAFIQKEVIEWITYQIANAGPSSIWNGFTYNSAKCERDVGFLIDRLIWDIGHGGNLKMRAAAQTYVNALDEGPYSTAAENNGTGTYLNLAAEADQDIASFNFMAALIEDVLNQDVPAQNYQTLNGVLTPVSQAFEAAITVESGVVNTSYALISIVTDALDAQDSSTIPERSIPTYTIFVKTGTFYETLPIIVPAETAVVGDELRSTNIRPAGSLIDLSDAYYTVDTFDHFDSIVQDIVQGNSVTPTTGNTELQSIAEPYATSTEANTIGTLVQLMKQQVDYRLGTMNDSLLTDPTGYNASYLIGYGDARKLIKENKKFLQEEVIAYLEANYPTLNYSKTDTRRDVGYIVDAIIYDLTYGGNALSVKAGLAYWDGDNDSQPQIPFEIRTATYNSVAYLRTLMINIATNATIVALQATIPQYRDTAGSAGSATFVGNNMTDVQTILELGPAVVGVTVTLSDPSTAWVAGALTTAYSTLSAAFTTIKNNVGTYLTTNYPGLLDVTNLNKAKRDAEIVLKAVGYDFMFNSNYQTIKAAHAYLRGTSEELFVYGTDIKEATRNSLEYARTQAIANVGGNATAIARINSSMAIVDTIFFSGSNEGSDCQTVVEDNYYASLQLERNRDFILAEIEAYMQNTFSDTVTNTTASTNLITISDTSWLKTNTAIRFTGTTFGNIATGTTYYVQKIVSSTQFKVALTRWAPDANVVVLTTDSGSMAVSLYYNSALCLRDVGTYIDALKYDLRYPGNYKSQYVARYYANAVTGSLEEDMYYVRNGTGIRNQTVQGLTGQLSPANQYGTRRPTAGAYVSLDPGWGPDDFTTWIIARSPYIQNVTTFGTGCVGQKIDGSLHNGGNDSIVSNDFTQVISDGIGAWVTNLGRAELVSVFTYYAHIGYLSENGGKIRGTNGNCSYGNFGAVAEGTDTSETAITAVVNNRNFDATIDFVFTSGSNIYRFEYLNAGQNYIDTTAFQINGSGSGAVAVGNEIRDGGVFECRLLDPGDSSTPGGESYVTITNNAQTGTTTQITLSATDTADGVTTSYVGMRIFIISGKGVGQFGYIGTYNTGSKVATILKESDGSSGWDHVVPGTTIQSSLDITSVYLIEPRITFTSPAYSSTARTLPASSVWDSVTYTSGSTFYINLSAGGGSGAGARFDVTRTNRGYRVTINDRGGGYSVGNNLTILGTALGGATPANDLNIAIDTTFTGGKITGVTPTGTAVGGAFVAIQTGSNNTAVSTNGTSWSAGGNLPASTTWTSLAAGVINNVPYYVAVASGGTQAASSVDNGTTWTSRTLSSSATWTSVAYGNSRFIAIASGGTANSVSTDGTNWVAGGALPASTTWTSVAHGAGIWVAIASGGTQAASSANNGTTWTSRTLPSSGTWTSVAYGNGRFVAVRSGSTAGAYSLDGLTWTATTLPASTNWSNISYGQGIFFAVSTSGVQAATSEDGITWTSRTMSTSASGYTSTVFGNPNNSGIWVAVGGGTGTVASSSLTGATTKARAEVTTDIITKIKIIEPGSGYTSPPTMTITDPNNTVEAVTDRRTANGVLANPSFTNRGLNYVTATSEISSGTGFADFFQTGSYVYVENLSDQPVPGSNIKFGTISDLFYKLVTVTEFVGNGPYSARLQVSPLMYPAEAPPHGDTVTINLKYSQVRLTGHDFLDIGTGNFTSTNYPGLPFVDPDKEKETNEFGGGRVFFTSTDQDGNFNVGDLFTVEQSTGIATLNANAFSLAGLQELTLGSVSLGGTGATITEFSTDPTFAADSDSILSTQRAVKAYIASQIGGGGGSLNVNSITAGVVYIAGDSITTTTNVQLNINTKVNFTGGIDGSPLAMSLFLLQ